MRHLRELGHPPLAPSRAELDLLDGGAVREMVARSKPRIVFHLAALASVARSWAEPAEPLLQNVAMTLNVLEAVRAASPDAALVVASSGEIYGPVERLPVDELAPLRPQNPYAVSKAACDLLAGQYADAHGLRVVRTRAFNHAGPGQSSAYVVGSLTRQVAEAELEGRSEAVLRTGSLDTSRDFTDVRDVVRAYVLAAELDPGAYNVCSGRSLSVGELVELLRASTELPLRAEVDPARLRPHDPPEIRGGAERLRAATGWAPTIPLERTVADGLAWWRTRLSGASSARNAGLHG